MIYPNPQIYHHLKTIFVHVPKAAGTSIERTLRESPKTVVGGHTTALGFKKKFPEFFDRYFKFAVVRHPVDRFISAYLYLKQHPVHPALNNQGVHESAGLDDWVAKAEASPSVLQNIVHFLPQHQFLCDADGKIMVDAVYRYERLEEAWREICERTGINHAPLPRLNPSVHDAGSISSSGRVNDFVAEVYKKDFKLLNYQAKSLLTAH